MAKRFIPVAAPSISPQDVAAVAAAVRSTWVSSHGPAIERFERGFAAYAGCRYALAVANGTVALHLALAALGIGPGDEVIVPDLTFVATANAVAYTGAVPVCVDVDLETWCIDPAAAERAITKRTKAIIPVHLYGYPADMAPLMALARRHKLAVLEDAAEAHGARYRGKPVGSFGAAAVFSFYGNKIITTGEGGMVTTNNARLYKAMRSLRNQGVHPTRRYWYTEIGFNYRMTNMQAALGLSQFGRVEKFIARKAEIVEGYRRAFKELPGVRLNPHAPGIRNVNWMACLVLPSRARRDGLMRAFDAANIESRPFFYPLSDLPMYRASARHRTPAAHRLSATGLNLPSGVGLSRRDLQTVIAVTKRYLAA